MAKVYHRPGDAKTLHDYPLLLSSSGDPDRVVFLSERDFNIIHNCLELTAKLRKRVFYSSDGPLYDIVNDADWLLFVSWVQDLENNMGEWQLSNLLLERIAIALENMEANQESVLSIEDAIAWAESTYGVSSIVATGVRAFLEAIPSLGFKIPITALWQLGTDIASFKTTIATLAGITAALGGIAASIAAHLPIAAANLLATRLEGMANILFQIEEAFQNWWNGESVSWWGVLSDIWDWITGDGEGEPPLNKQDEIQIRQAQALESISDHLGGIKQCVCSQGSSNGPTGGADDMGTVININNGCCSTCGGFTGGTSGSNDQPPQIQPPLLPPWLNPPTPTEGSFPASFGTLENYLQYRCQVAEAIYQIMKQTTSMFSVYNMIAWIAVSFTQGWQAATAQISTIINASVVGTILLPGGGLASAAIGLLNLIRLNATYIYTLAFFDSAGLAAWMEENKPDIICALLEKEDYNFVHEVFQNQVMEVFGATEASEEFYTEVFKWLCPPALASALMRDARAEIDLNGITPNMGLCECDPVSGDIGAASTYALCAEFTGEPDAGFTGPVPSGTGETGWTSNDGAIVTQGEGLALMNYPSATITGVNGIQVNIDPQTLVEGENIAWWCAAISLGFNDFRCEVQLVSDSSWVFVEDNLTSIQPANAYINFGIGAPLDGLEIKAARLLIKGQNFCNIGHMYIGSEPCE